MKIRNFILFAAIASLIGCHTVDPGTSGVVVDWDGVQSEPLPEGFHTINPITDSVVNYPTKVQVYDTPAKAMSKDMQLANTQVTVNYKISMADTPKMYKGVGMIEDVEHVIIRPKVQDTLKKYTARYAAADLIGDRDAVSTGIRTELVAELEELDIIVTEVSLTNFEFAEEFQASVERKQIAEQDAMTAKNQVEIERAESEKIVVRAEADAAATLARAQAQAEANKLLDRSLTRDIIAYEAVQKWDGHYPGVVGGDGLDLLISVE